jgi:SAM-dependent methyltransferase
MTVTRSTSTLTIKMPPQGDGATDQDTEWCWVSVPGERPRRLRFHDYAEIYQIPGLYERLFHDELKCASPETVRALLEEVVSERGGDPTDLRVLDLGAGSGLVAEQLDDLGAGYLFGVDIIEEARQAAERDRPGLYDAYCVDDLCTPSAETDRALREAKLTCLTSVAALGFGDIPPLAFANAYNYIAPGGLVAFNVRDRFLEDGDTTGYRGLLDRMLAESIARPMARRHYRHRFSVSGEPLHYIAMVAEKVDDIPDDWA